MPTYGLCTPVERAADAKSAGWDYVEEHIQSFLQGALPDDEWAGPRRLQNLALPVPAANTMVPAAMKITGPDADLETLGVYMARVMARAQRAGIKTLVFGSGPARSVPDGFDRAAARRQILDFLRMSLGLAVQHEVLLVAEHMNRGESNIINSIAEAMEYVREMNHPNFQCLADSYHFWLEGEPLESLRAATPWVRHVHLADAEGRVPPGESGKNDYRPFFAVLKEGGYDGRISVESPAFTDVAGAGPRVLEFLKRQWKEA